MPPYFDQVGLSILMRRIQPDMSMLKFMWVFKEEVWLVVLGIFFGMTIFIWGIEKISPYSYYNNKQVNY